SAQHLKDGWYHTGDVMRRGDGNQIWFVSRKKDIIIRGGTNISPLEVEEALMACHSAVEAAVVVGKPDAVLGQRVGAFVTLTNGARASVVVDEILHNLEKRIAPYKIPESLRVLDALPRNALSKVDRRKLEALASVDESERSIS